MSDSYKHIPEGVSSIISSLKEVIDDYKDKVTELTLLINEIATSPSWKDASVKTSFVATANSYISMYQEVVTSMENYVNYLTKKSESADALEEAFARG